MGDPKAAHGANKMHLYRVLGPDCSLSIHKVHKVQSDAGRPTTSWTDMTATAWRFTSMPLGCEGIVSKRLGSPYRAGRTDQWLKMKSPEAPAVRRESEIDWAKR